MKKWLITGLTVMLCMAILLVIGSGCLISLSNQIRSLTVTIEDLNKNVMEMYRQLSAVESELNKLYEDSNSLLAMEDVTPGDFDPQTGTVNLHLQLAPKIVTEDMELSVTMGSQKLVLTRYDTIFTGDLKVGLFEEELPVLTITSSAGVQTQSLETVSSGVFFYTDYLPQIWRNMFGVSDSSEGKTMLDVGFCFDRSMLRPDVAADFESITLIRERNGREELRQDVTKLVQETGELGMSAYATSFLIEPNEEVLVQIIAVDTYGYEHQITLRCGAQGDVEETSWLQEETMQICDSSGNVLYTDSY
jgi:hypothetical protein